MYLFIYLLIHEPWLNIYNLRLFYVRLFQKVSFLTDLNPRDDVGQQGDGQKVVSEVHQEYCCISKAKMHIELKNRNNLSHSFSLFSFWFDEDMDVTECEDTDTQVRTLQYIYTYMYICITTLLNTVFSNLLSKQSDPKTTPPPPTQYRVALSLM